MRASFTIYITLPPGGDDPNHPQAYLFNRPGDIIHVAKREQGPYRHPRFAFIHVDDIPDKVKMKKLRERLLEPIMFYGFEGAEILRKRKWHVSWKRLTKRQRSDLLNTGELTLPWDVMRGFIRTKTLNVIADHSMDTDEIVLKESDV